MNTFFCCDVATGYDFRLPIILLPSTKRRKVILRKAVDVFFFGDEDSDATVQASDESQCNTDEQVNYSESVFESIRHINEFGQEFWYARELQIALEYKQWRRFCNVIDNAKEAFNGSGNIISDHFADVGKMVNIGSDAEHELMDIALSRYNFI